MENGIKHEKKKIVPSCLRRIWELQKMRCNITRVTVYVDVEGWLGFTLPALGYLSATKRPVDSSRAPGPPLGAARVIL